MKTVKRTYKFFKEKYKLLTLKKYTTIAGTLVFFLIMSIVPLSFLLTLLVGKLPIDVEEVLSLPVFESVQNILLYVKREAENATASVSVILILTTLYSSTTLFYQMRKSGEIIYDYTPAKHGVRLRVGALVLLLIVLGTVLAFLLLYALGSLLFAKFLPEPFQKFANYVLLFLLSFFLVLLLNVYICPYEEKMRRFLPGAFATMIAWIGAIVGFSVYIKIGNLGRLYGALSTIIVFLLWLYVLMICFIAGVIFNSEKITFERAQARNKRKKKNKNKT